MKARILAMLLLPLSVSVQAAEFGTLQADRSGIAFVSKQMNVPMEGTFRKFSAQIVLDPAKPETGRARIEIDLASTDTGNAEANGEVKGKDWFNVREHPSAVFVSNAVRALGGGRFETTGKLSIKGRTLDARAPFTIRQDKDTLILDGGFPLKRLDFGIGSGAWGDTSVVADEVQVKFHFVLK